MTYAEAVKTLSYKEIEQVEQRMYVLARDSGLGSQAVANIRNESRLSAEAWQTIFRGLLSAPLDSGVITYALTDSLRCWTLKGPALSVPGSIKLGRAITIDRFCRMLVKLGYFASNQTAWRAVRSIISKPAGVAKWRLGHVKLGLYLIWSTFNPGIDEAGPFDEMPKEADVIMGRLGLDRNERGKSLLLLEYMRPPEITLRFPTVAEAYAGQQWSYFFRPATQAAAYGMTMPWPEYEREAPLPETVHEPTHGANLSAPVRRVY
jgi:hypothetical protein